MSISPLIDRLPEELLLSIFEFLDSEPPSVIKSRQEPSLDITSSNIHSLKDLSLVSRSWRRIALPVLFRYSRLCLDEPGGAGSLDDFLDFSRNNDLHITSIVTLTSKDSINPDNTPDFWPPLLEGTNPSRIVIVAPPADVARLTECTIDLSTEWAFQEMDYHSLELRCDPPPRKNKSSDSPASRILSPNPSKIAESSILMRRPWTHLALNEGSFLKAYGTYEYFERGPPSVISSILTCFSSPSPTAQASSSSSSSFLRSFSYTAILPFAGHLDFRAILPHLDSLDVQLAPDPGSNILNDKSRIGRAQMEDCWQELREAYRLRECPL